MSLLATPVQLTYMVYSHKTFHYTNAHKTFHYTKLTAVCVIRSKAIEALKLQPKKT